MLSYIWREKSQRSQPANLDIALVGHTGILLILFHQLFSPILHCVSSLDFTVALSRVPQAGSAPLPALSFFAGAILSTSLSVRPPASDISSGPAFNRATLDVFALTFGSRCALALALSLSHLATDRH